MKIKSGKRASKAYVQKILGAKYCPAGKWTLRVRGTATARYIRGCYATEIAARRAADRMHDKRGFDRGSVWIVTTPGGGS